MLSIPRPEETKAKGVGIQVLKADEILIRNGVVGVQYAGGLEDRMGGESEDIVKTLGVWDCVYRQRKLQPYIYFLLVMWFDSCGRCHRRCNENAICSCLASKNQLPGATTDRRIKPGVSPMAALRTQHQSTHAQEGQERKKRKED